MADFLAVAVTSVWGVLSYIGPFLFVLGLVIFVHEYGHYIVGRWCGVGIDAFSLGFGPKLIGWRDKRGTEWKLAAIPLGGYVKFRGDLNAASMPDDEAAAAMSKEDRALALQFKPVWQRAAIVAAGPIANFILAIVIFSGTLMVYGRYEVAPVVGVVEPNSPAARAGVLAGDRILTINGTKVETFEALRNAVSGADNDTMEIEVARNRVVVPLTLQTSVVEQKTPFGMMRSRMLGVRSSANPEDRQLREFGPGEAVVAGSVQVVDVIRQSIRFLGRLLTGREHVDQLSGPIKIAEVSGKVAESGGFVSLLSLAALVSVSIGFINLLPIPILDGGHLAFYAYEALFGRPLTRRRQEMFFRIGFALVIALMAFSVINDIVQKIK